MEAEISKEGKHIDNCTRTEMDHLWEKAKQKFQD
jgi:uncharacterized protein YabN with tetrapyrrole methylase and pyrophosphatase domain